MRLSIGRAMIGVALLGIAFCVVSLDINDGSVHRRMHDLIVGVLPMMTILIYGLLAGSIDLALGRPTPRYLVGFQAGGWASIIVYLAWCTSTYDWMDRPLKWLVGTLSWALGNRDFGYDDPAVFAAHMAAFLTPEVTAAILGGWLGSRIGVVLVRQSAVRN